MNSQDSITIRPAGYPYKAYIILRNGETVSGAATFARALLIAATYLDAPIRDDSQHLALAVTVET